jgi:two-component system, chemotaxis family, protein-glutamate methylesterase/glutaminase
MLSEKLTMKAVVLGASSGGPKALDYILKKLPVSTRAVVVVVQHLPPSFSESFVYRLKTKLMMPINLTKEGETLLEGKIYVVPGNKNFFITSPDYKVKLIEAEGNNKPSVDMTFTSVAEHFGANTLGVILTGMGEDGVLGCKAIKQLGGQVIVQDKETSAVYGMPMEVLLAGHADESLALEDIPSKILEFSNDQIYLKKKVATLMLR